MQTPRAGRVVVGLRASLAGYEALRYAVQQARDRSVDLVAVISYRAPDSALGIAWHQAVRDEAAAQAVRIFTTALGGQPADVNFQVRVMEGTPARVLTSIADRSADVIVIGGSHGRRLLRRAAVANYCARHASCPVVVIPPPELACSKSPARLARDAASTAEKLLEDCGFNAD